MRRLVLVPRVRAGTARDVGPGARNVEPLRDGDLGAVPLQLPGAPVRPGALDDLARGDVADCVGAAAVVASERACSRSQEGPGEEEGRKEAVMASPFAATSKTGAEFSRR